MSDRQVRGELFGLALLAAIAMGASRALVSLASALDGVARLIAATASVGTGLLGAVLLLAVIVGLIWDGGRSTRADEPVGGTNPGHDGER